LELTINSLPDDHTRISQPDLRDLRANDSAKQAEKRARRRDESALEQSREQAMWEKATEIEEAKAAGKPAPKRDPVAEHDKKLEAARMAYMVAVKAAERARSELLDGIEKFGPTWIKEVTARNAELDDHGRDWWRRSKRCTPNVLLNVSSFVTPAASNCT
jgi:hypothetical protein